MWQVIGQDRAVSLLQNSMERGTLAHAYLLAGPPHVGKMTLALNLAQAVNCDTEAPPCGECASCQKIASGKHADVQIIGLASNGNSAETKPQAEIGIDQIREVQHSSSLPPFEGRYKVFIIDEAEHLSIEAANCLLKTLEEPVGNALFILLATSGSLLPDTVVSRCQQLELPPLASGEVEAALDSRWGIEVQKARLLARLCRGRLGWALSAAGDDSLLQQRAEKLDRLLEVISAGFDERFAYAAQLAAQFGQSRGAVHEVLDLWVVWWRDLLLIKTGCGDAITNVDLETRLVDQANGYSLAQIKAVIDSILAAGEQLEQNVNPQLVLEMVMLNIPKRRAQ
ncbi:ATP-binding protein [Chloroflexota bacterium]